jgi:hypothetical protein
MGVIDRTFRLTNETGGLGLSCGPFGLSLAGVPLLYKSGADFAVRPPEEIEALVKAAYGAQTASPELLSAFDAVARALNRRDLAHAMTVAVLTRLPELDWDGAARLANAEQQIRKYNPDEPRDLQGRWTSDDGADMSGQDRLPQNPVDFSPEESGSATVNHDDNNEPPDNRPPLERKYDDLGPVAFAKQAILFGDQLGRQGKILTPEERDSARAEYDFLQSRLSFWLGYGDKPFEADANLKSAALTLFVGAHNGRVISVPDGFPPSMLNVALDQVGQDNHQPDIPLRVPAIGEVFDGTPVPSEGRSPSEEFGVATAKLPSSDVFNHVVDNAEVGIDWDNGIVSKGGAWELYNARVDPGARRIGYNSKTFDSFRDSTAEAISEKVLDPLSYSYVNYPERIYGQIKKYVDTAADYSKPRTEYDLKVNEIDSRTVKIAVHDYISPVQREQFIRAVQYGESRNVTVIITRIP